MFDNITYVKGFCDGLEEGVNLNYRKMLIDRVICNAPATVVFWQDKTKTVVKCQDGEPYDAEKGIAMAFIKKFYGNKGTYYELFKCFAPEDGENK